MLSFNKVLLIYKVKGKILEWEFSIDKLFTPFNILVIALFLIAIALIFLGLQIYSRWIFLFMCFYGIGYNIRAIYNNYKHSRPGIKFNIATIILFGLFVYESIEYISNH